MPQPPALLKFPLPLPQDGARLEHVGRFEVWATAALGRVQAHAADVRRRLAALPANAPALRATHTAQLTRLDAANALLELGMAFLSCFPAPDFYGLFLQWQQETSSNGAQQQQALAPYPHALSELVAQARGLTRLLSKPPPSPAAAAGAAAAATSSAQSRRSSRQTASRKKKRKKAPSSEEEEEEVQLPDTSGEEGEQGEVAAPASGLGGGAPSAAVLSDSDASGWD
jgi:hypothetical protein